MGAVAVKGTVAPTSPEKTLSQLTQTLGSRLTEVSFKKFELSSDVAPSKEVRSVLTARRKELEDAIDSHASEMERATVIIEMISAFRIDLPKKDAAGWAASYVAVLEGYPLWAISKARTMVMRGEDVREKKGFMPTPPEFVQTVEGLVRPFRSERQTLHRILTAKVCTEPTEEERARVAARLKQVVAGMAARAEQDERAEKEAEFRRQEAIDEAAKQAAATAAARQSGLSPSSPEAERSSSPETHSASE